MTITRKATVSCGSYEAIDVDGLTLYAIGDEWEWEEVA